MNKNDFIEKVREFCNEEHIKFGYYHNTELECYNIRLGKTNKGVKKSIRKVFSVTEIENTPELNLMSIVYEMSQQLYDSIQNEVYRK